MIDLSICQKCIKCINKHNEAPNFNETFFHVCHDINDKDSVFCINSDKELTKHSEIPKPCRYRLEQLISTQDPFLYK